MRVEQGVKVYSSGESQYKKPRIGEFFVAGGLLGLYVYQQTNEQPKRVIRLSSEKEAIKTAAFFNKENISTYLECRL